MIAVSSRLHCSNKGFETSKARGSMYPQGSDLNLTVNDRKGLQLSEALMHITIRKTAEGGSICIEYKVLGSKVGKSYVEWPDIATTGKKL